MESRCFINKKLNLIHICGEITQYLASSFRMHFARLEASGEPITVEINSEGGDIPSGITICDTIRLSKSKVITRVAGEAYSIAALILASGDEREALPNATIMVHKGSHEVGGEHDTFKTEVAQCVKFNSLSDVLMNKYTGKPKGYWEKFYVNGNFYMTPKKALELKLLTRVLK